MTVQTFSHSEFFNAFPQFLYCKEESIKILMIGDVIGSPGRKILKSVLPKLRESANLDFVTANAENLAGGFGVTEKTFQDILNAGVDVATMGNHWSDKPDVHIIRKTKRNLVLPQNLPGLHDVKRVPEFEIEIRNKKVSIINLMGLFAMKDSYDNPYDFLQKERENLETKIRSGSHIILVDVHAEGSAEKQVMAWYLDGIAAALIGTHTHTPTSDERVTRNGTAFLTDVGMTGAYESVIGMTIEKSLKRYFSPIEKRPQEVATGDVWFCGFLVEISPKSCLAMRAHRLQFREAEGIWRVSSAGKS